MAELLTWHGELPRGWRAVPLAFLVDAISGSTPTKDEATYWGGVIPWVSPKDMKRPVIADAEDHITKTALAKSGIRLVQPEAVLVVVRGMILAHSFPVGVTTVPVTVNQDMKALKPRRGIEPWFLAYALRACTAPMLGLVEQAGHGTCKLRTDLWRRFPLPLPPIEAQRAIISFLDRKTAAIDALIAKKERLIELLEEKRQALITQAVTKGLDPNVPMKDSGIDWLGPIPAHWRVARLAHVFGKIGSGTTPPTHREELYDGEIPWVTTSELRENVVTSTQKTVTTSAVREFSALRIWPPGTILVAMYGATIGRLARLGISACVNQACCALAAPAQVVPEFVVASLEVFRDQLIALGSGGGQPNISQEKIRGFRLAIPPMHEQEAIAARLAQILGHREREHALLQESVGRLREYRQALITAAVTGKIDVTCEA